MILKEKLPVMTKQHSGKKINIKEVVADLVLRYDIVKKLDHTGSTENYKKYMRHKVPEKQEIIQHTIREKNMVVKIAMDYPGLISRELAYKMANEQQIYIRIKYLQNIKVKWVNHRALAHIFLNAGNEFREKTGFVQQI